MGFLLVLNMKVGILCLVSNGLRDRSFMYRLIGALGFYINMDSVPPNYIKTFSRMVLAVMLGAGILIVPVLTSRGTIIYIWWITLIILIGVGMYREPERVIAITKCTCGWTILADYPECVKCHIDRTNDEKSAAKDRAISE